MYGQQRRSVAVLVVGSPTLILSAIVIGMVAVGFSLAVERTLLAILVVWSAIGAVGLLIWWFLNARREDAKRAFEATYSNQLSERLTRAAFGLHDDRIGVRLATISDMGRIAREATNLTPEISLLLTSFIRTSNESTQWRDQLGPLDRHAMVPLRADLQAAARVLSRLPRGEGSIRLDLRHISLPAADLSDAQFDNADLDEADLTGANLIGALLRGSTLRRSVLTGCNLMAADASGADFQDAAMAGARLAGARLEGASLIGADLRGASLASANLERCQLVNADLRGTDLRGVRLENANLVGAKLAEAQLTGATLGGALLTRSSLRDTDLSGAESDLSDVPYVEDK